MYSTTQLKISGQSKEKNDLLIDSILTTLGLEKVKNIRCGNLSGGQRKRLSIALELIDDPPILFLDEPTTGLDSSSSNQCVQMLKTLAERGRTIVCTIHQPSASMYHLFSHVYIMAKGKCVYQGAPENTVPYLALHGYICPKYHNPADFLLEVTSDASTQDIDKFAIAATETNWRSSINSENDKVSEKEVDIKRQSDSYDYPDVDRSKRPQSQWKVFKVLLKKQFIHQYRDWTVAKLKLVVHFLVGIFLGVTFQNCGNDASKTLQNFSFFITGVVYLCYTSLMPAALRFPQELKIIKKEHFNRWYKLRTFYAAFLAADLPMQNGTFIGAISTVTMLSVAGFLCFFPHMNTVFYYASNLSYFSFSMEGLLQAVYGYNREKLVCPEDEIFCLYTSPKQFLTELGMDKLPYWVDVGWITGYFILFRLLAYYSLKFRLKHL
ncbi:hypothetical protein YQE_01157, partial [Dendroctonus ponderosae]